MESVLVGYCFYRILMNFHYDVTDYCHKITEANGVYLLIDSNRNIRTRCEICSKSTIKTPKWHQWEMGSKWKRVVYGFTRHPSMRLQILLFSLCKVFTEKKIEIFAKGIQIFVEALRRDTKNIGTRIFLAIDRV